MRYNRTTDASTPKEKQKGGIRIRTTGYTRTRFLRWTAVLLWMGVIFWFSHQDAQSSSTFSSAVLEFLLTLFRVDSSDIAWPNHPLYSNAVFLLRKCAHFFVFTVLGLLAYHAVHSYPDATRTQRLVIPLSLGIVYACTDELHQFFIPGRACQIRDVCIDSAGVLCGILLCMLLHRWTGRAGKHCPSATPASSV